MQMNIPRHLPNPHNGNRFPSIANMMMKLMDCWVLSLMLRRTSLESGCWFWMDWTWRPRWYGFSVSEKMNISDYYEDSIDGVDGEEEIPQWILHLSFLVWALLATILYAKLEFILIRGKLSQNCAHLWTFSRIRIFHTKDVEIKFAYF